MTAFLKTTLKSSIKPGWAVAALVGLCLSLAAVPSLAGDSKPSQDKPRAILDTDQYPLAADTVTKAIYLRINPQGLSDNQVRALDQVAAKAAWTSDEPVDVEIITGGDPASVSAGQTIGTYLMAHDVSDTNLRQRHVKEQPSDIVTVNLIYFRAHTYDCNRTWDNLSATGGNKPWANYGCALSSNIAAQVADPRDLSAPAATASGDAGRRSVQFEKYRKGEVTSSDTSDESKGTISDAIK